MALTNSDMNLNEKRATSGQRGPHSTASRLAPDIYASALRLFTNSDIRRLKAVKVDTKLLVVSMARIAQHRMCHPYGKSYVTLHWVIESGSFQSFRITFSPAGLYAHCMATFVVIVSRATSSYL